MVPAQEASSSHSIDALSHPTSLEFSETDIIRIREAVGKLPKYPKTGQWATDKDLSKKHTLLRTMVRSALMQPEYVLPMHEAYLSMLNRKSQIIGPNQEAEPRSPKGSQTSLPKQTHSKCEKSKGGPSVQKSSPQRVGGAKANPCPTRGQQCSSKPQHQADQSQKESMTQQQQPQTKTEGKTAVATKACENPSESERPPDCGPVSPGDWLQICDVDPPYEKDILKPHRLSFEIWLGCVIMRIITWSSYLEHVEEGDWLWVRSVTFNKKGVPWIFQFVKRFKDTDVDIQARFVEAQILEPAEPECLPDDEVTATPTFQ